MSPRMPLVILLNGPLGIGKSTLSEVLGESIERSVALDGDQLAGLNPPPTDEVSDLHETLALLVAHHHAKGYLRFIINHYWERANDIADLRDRMQSAVPGAQVHCYRLCLSEEENLRRIARRQSARAIDETEFEDQRFAEEHALFSRAVGDELGVPFDAGGAPEALAARMLAMLGLPSPA